MNDTEALAQELLAMAAEDLRVRDELTMDGALFDGYHPRMRAVHQRNATRLIAILDQHGWPGPWLVGDDAADAAWLVLQHAIDAPTLQRRGLHLLREAAQRHEVRALQIAMLEDRIRCLEGNPQRYGTQFDWDATGELSPLPVEDAAGVDARRQRLGLRPLAEETRLRREQALREGEHPPQDRAARQAGMLRWQREAGWRE
jgi:hypothetical protein